MTIQYTPRGVCSRSFTIQVEDGLIQSVQVVGGCSGNLQGISMLLKGMPVEEAIRRMEGIRCGSKATSCPDQLAQALKQAQADAASKSRCASGSCRTGGAAAFVSRYSSVTHRPVVRAWILSPSRSFNSANAAWPVQWPV